MKSCLIYCVRSQNKVEKDYFHLFGSCTKGNLDINSDIDLLVITKSLIDKNIKMD